MIRRFKVGFDVELHKRTLERGLLSLIGPRRRRASAARRACRRGRARATAPVEDRRASRALAVRTDVGVDVLCEAEPTASGLPRRCCERGAAPVSEAAAECLRVERGRPRYGIDLDDTVIPQEAGLNERAVSFTKGCYVGQETVARLHYKGKPNRHLRGLRLSAPRRARRELRLGERPVGRLGSTALSPELGPIALALVRREAEPGAGAGRRRAAGRRRGRRAAVPARRVQRRKTRRAPTPARGRACVMHATQAKLRTHI